MTTLPPPPHAYPAPRLRRRGTLIVVIAAQLLAVGGTAFFVAVSVVLLILARPSPNSLPALLFEQIAGLIVPVAVLCALHLAVVVGLLRGRHWGILLHALVSIGYAGFGAISLAGGRSRSADAQHSVLVIVLIGVTALFVLNALAFANWRHTR